MIAAVLALLASLIWGASDFGAGFMGRRTTVWSVVLITQTAGLIATGIVVAATGHPFPPPAGWLAAMTAGLLGLVAVTSFYTALSIGLMSLVASISSTGILVPVLVGLVRGERPSPLQYVGMALAIGGVILASREPRRPKANHDATTDDATDEYVATGPAGALAAPPPLSERHSRGPRALAAWARTRSATTLSFSLALVAAGAIGTAYVAMAKAAQHDAYWGVFLMRATSLPLVLTTIMLVRPRLELAPRHVLPIVLVGVGDTTANTMFAVASTCGYLSVVSVLGYLYPIVTVMLAHLVLHERLAAVQRVAAAAALAGAIMVAA